MNTYLRPGTLEEAVAALVDASCVVLAGGTDHYPSRVGQPLDDNILDISGLSGLRGIADEGDWIRIGALTTWTEIATAALPAGFEGLRQAAGAVGGIQVQNTGTIGGNLCNASPAADGMPNLLVLDALVELTSASGVRTAPVAGFVTGNRQTLRRPDELLTGLLIPRPPENARSCFLKLGARAYMVISIAMVGALLVPDGSGAVAEARIAVGACSPVAMRLPGLEAVLAGARIGPDLAQAVQPEHLEPLSPIDDVRGAAAYRNDAALTLVRRALGELAA